MLVACVVAVLALAIAATLAYLYSVVRRNFQFWRERNVPYLEPVMPFGNTADSVVTQRHFALIAQDWYTQLRRRPSVRHYAGVYIMHRPALVVLSPEFAKTVLVRDFGTFVNRGIYYNKQSDPLSGNLFFIEGDEWRQLRAKMTPTFTSGKMKLMFHTICGVADRLAELLTTMLAVEARQEINIREYLARFTTDVIGACAFGLECDSIRNPESEFREMGKKMFNFTQIQSLKLMASMLARETARKLGVQFNTTEVNEFVLQLVQKTIAHRRANPQERRNDFMQLMIDLHELPHEEGGLSVEEIAAQSFVFFFAGFETSATTMAYAMYELALNPTMQERVRAEVAEQAADGDFSYEQIMGMSYMDQVISEALRKYPPVSTLHRIVNNDYKLPCGANVDRGTFLVIPTYAIHHDPELYPQPERFDPERFSDEQKSGRHPFAYLPFGEGPRICIGLRFGQLQAKIGLASLLRRFRFEVCERTEVPIKVDQINLLYVPLNGVWLRVVRV